MRTAGHRQQTPDPNSIVGTGSNEQRLGFQKTLLECQSEASIDGILVVSVTGEMISFNRRFAEMWDVPDEVLSTRSDAAALRFVEDKLDDPVEFLAKVSHLYEHPDEESRDEIVLKDGRTFDRYGAPVKSSDGVRYGRVWFFRDITERKRAEEALRTRERQQAAVAQLGSDALSGADVGDLLERTVSLLAENLQVEYAKLLELLPDGRALLVRAGVGWREGVVGSATVDAGERSQAGYTLFTGRPVIFADLRSESRFEGMPILHEQGVISGMNVVIPGTNKPFGVLGAYTAERRLFTEDDVNFLQAVANVLATAITRRRVEEALSEKDYRLNLAMQAGRMGTWEWDIPSGRVTWSESLESIHGLDPGSFGGTFEDYLRDIHPEDREHVVATTKRSLERGLHEIEYRIIRPNGSVRWLAARGQVFMDAAGRPVKVIGICGDITERRRNEETERFLAEATSLLAASSLNYAMTLASVARQAVPYLGDWCAIDVLEEDQTVTHVALAHQDPSKVEMAQELQRRYPFDPDRPYGLARVLRTGEPEFYPEISEQLLREVVEDDELIRVIRQARLRSVICVPLVARGRTLGGITVATAESGRRYDEYDLALAQELARRAALAVDNARLHHQVLEANEAKDEFLGLVSHELRTPITAIYGGARMLRSRGERLDEDSKARILSDVEQESERLFRMVENLLALARVELGQKVDTEPVLAQRVVEKLVSDFARRRPSRRLDVHIEPDLKPVAAQPTYLEQVVRNLLSNADKYSPEDSPIEISVGPVGDDIAVAVLDRGPGVAADEAEFIFDRFYRSGRSSSRAKGAGLGLTVCKRLIEAQGGRVWARRRDGGGLEVGFALPAWQEVIA